MLESPRKPQSYSGTPVSGMGLPSLVGPPIFVSGCNRGGTTILSRLLAAHPDVRSVGRGPFHEGQYVWRRQFPDWSRHRWALPPWRWYLRRTEAHATPERVRFFREEFSRAVEGEGRMLEKTPANAVRIPFINAVFPDCVFVHIIRDGRHTTASLMARGVWLPFAPHQWVQAHRTALPDLEKVPPERVVRVRYEELVAAPPRVLTEIWRNCGLRVSGQDVEDALYASCAQVEDPDDRWARLPLWKRRYISSVIADLQAEFGYPTGP